MRFILQLVVVLSGLLLAREFMAHSNEQLRLALRWAKVVSESIATVHSTPTLVGSAEVARITEVPALSIATVREPPALVAPVAVTRIAEVFEQNLVTVHEPPALVALVAVAQIAEVSAQNIATVREPPSLVAPVAAARIDGSPRSGHRYRARIAGAGRTVGGRTESGSRSAERCQPCANRQRWSHPGRSYE